LKVGWPGRGLHLKDSFGLINVLELQVIHLSIFRNLDRRADTANATGKGLLLRMVRGIILDEYGL
jgi:hypothetical protein